MAQEIRRKALQPGAITVSARCGAEQVFLAKIASDWGTTGWAEKSYCRMRWKAFVKNLAYRTSARRRQGDRRRVERPLALMCARALGPGAAGSGQGVLAVLAERYGNCAGIDDRPVGGGEQRQSVSVEIL